ncbi:MAG: hypothetical protein ACRD17_11510 [Terriglobales bacterium]
MTGPFPLATVGDGAVAIRFADSAPSEWVRVKCVLDLNGLGEPVGIEVLDWRRQLGGAILDAPKASATARWAYDDEIDAISIHLAPGTAPVQRSAWAAVGLDSRRRVVSLDLRLPGPGHTETEPRTD